MRSLFLMESRMISGGIAPAAVAAMEAVAIGVAVFEAPILVKDGINTYGDIGSRIGEIIFDATHPNPLGQMTFTINDFPNLR